MPRKRTRKTERGKNFHCMEIAARIVKAEERSLREVANEFDLCHVSLYRYVKKLKNYERFGTGAPPTVGYKSHTRVFSDEYEKKSLIIFYKLLIYTMVCPPRKFDALLTIVLRF